MRRRSVLVPLLTALALAVMPANAPPDGADLAARGWVWPVSPVQIVAPYVQPASAYSAGHRGLDLAGGEVVRAPADGVVAFSGTVVDREVVTIDHGDELVSSFEPVTDALPVGTTVTRGDVIARVGAGGHTMEGALHFGVRLAGEYVNPQLLLGGVPRAVLLPCCAPVG